MERIGKIGWFLTDEEMAKLQEAFDTLRLVLPRKEDENTDTLTGDKGNTIPYAPNRGIGINEPCPNCPWRNPNPDIGDWTWRPWQAPWYGNPGKPISPDEWKIGDGEWWKYQPYSTSTDCTSTTEDNPNATKETKAFNAKTLDDLCK